MAESQIVISAETEETNILRRAVGAFAVWMLNSANIKLKDHPAFIPYGNSRRGKDRRAADRSEISKTALDLWRDNPIARRIVQIYAGHAIGDGIYPTAEEDAPQAEELGEWLRQWWDHPQNLMEFELKEIAEELSRTGDIFPTIHFNPVKKEAFVRTLPGDLIDKILHPENDWKTETGYTELRRTEENLIPEPVEWYHPSNEERPAGENRVMVHYKVNGVTGGDRGDSDLATLRKWLPRYDNMAKDRVRLNWAMKLILWHVKRKNYASLSQEEKDDLLAQYEGIEQGGLIITDAEDEIEPKVPRLNAKDSEGDFRTIKRIINAGSFPDTYLGAADTTNLAGTRSLDGPAIKILRDRQKYLIYMVRDLAYWSAKLSGAFPNIERHHIGVHAPDISREDNINLAEAADKLSSALSSLKDSLSEQVDQSKLNRLFLKLVLKFAGEPHGEKDLSELITNDNSDAR